MGAKKKSLQKEKSYQVNYKRHNLITFCCKNPDKQIKIPVVLSASNQNIVKVIIIHLSLIINRDIIKYYKNLWQSELEYFYLIILLQLIDNINDEEIVDTKILEEYLENTIYPMCIKKYQTKLQGNGASTEDGGPFIVSLIMEAIHCNDLARSKIR